VCFSDVCHFSCVSPTFYLSSKFRTVVVFGRNTLRRNIYMEIFKFWIPKIPGSRISYFLSAIDRVRQNWRDAFWGKNPSYPKFSLHYYVHQTLSHGDFFFLHVDDFMPAQILDWGTTFPQIFYIEYYLLCQSSGILCC